MSDFRLRLSIDNPVSTPMDGPQRDYFEVDRPVSTNKAFSMQLSRSHSLFHLFEFDLKIAFTGEDHAGPSLSLTFLYWFFIISLYDMRHWDYDNDCWQSNVDAN